MMTQADNAPPLLITVNVDLPRDHASHGDPVRLFMQGETGQGASVLERLLDIADRAGLRLVFFIDYCAHNRYGGLVREIARLLDEAGQEVAPLLHPRVLRDAFWKRRRMEPAEDLLSAAHEQLEVVLDYVLGQHLLAVGARPLAVRGTDYEYGRSLLELLTSRHVKFHSGVAPLRPNQPLWLMRQAPFQWESGPLELPITILRTDSDAWQDMLWRRFPAEVEEVLQRLDVCVRQGRKAPVIMALDLKGFIDRERTPPRMDVERLRAFARFAAYLAQRGRTWGLRDVLRAREEGALQLDAPVPIDIFGHVSHRRAHRMAPRDPVKEMEKKWRDNPALLSEKAEDLWNDPERDPERQQAVRLFRKAFELGETRWAAYRLGYALLYGMGTERDLEEASRMLLRQDLEDISSARFVRSRLYEDKDSPEHSLEKALAEMKAALEMGLKEAQNEVYRLERMVRSGP